MNFLISVMIPLLAFMAISSRAECRQLVADSKISSVTVFNDRAMVTRSVAVKLDKGFNQITFDNLPVFMNEESIRAEAKGGTVARISELNLRNIYLDKSIEGRVRELEAEIRSLERKIQKIDSRRSALAAQRDFIDSIKVGWGERISKELSLGKPTGTELSDANRFIGDGIYKIEEQLSETNLEKLPLLDALAALKKRLDNIKAEGAREARSVDISVEASRSTELIIDLSYLVEHARWEPAYDIRLAADGKSAELVYRAIVSQKTGEYWQGVNLSLSSANPAIGSSPPELNPWHISFYTYPRPYERQTNLMRKSGLAEAAPLASQMEVNKPAAPKEADSQDSLAPIRALVTEGQTSVLFNVRKTLDVPSDGSRKSTVIALERVPVAAEYVTIPKLSPLVFLKTEVTNMTSYPLLSGEVHVFNDTAYTGKSYLKSVAAGDKFDLYFGSDDLLKVKRKAHKIKKEAGLIAGNLVTWRCSVEIENFKPEPVQLSLMDQLPVAGNEEIKVSISEAQPKPDEIKPDGTILWKVSLMPGEKKKYNYEIDVEYPKGRDLNGVD